MVLAAVFLPIAVRQVGRFNLKIWQIMLGGAVAVLAVLFLSPRRFAILRTIDWPTLVFFAAIFLLMESV